MTTRAPLSDSPANDELVQVFQEAYRDLRPATAVPAISVRFFAYANINNTIRLRQGKLFVRLSDLLEGAPEPVLRGIAHILLAKMYRKSVDRGHSVRYRRYVSSHDLRNKVHLIRQIRGRKLIVPAQGIAHNLEDIFDELNAKFFRGLLARPLLSWSRDRARNRLGHYDPAHNAIVVSRIFDIPRVPRYAVEYIVYHEMLHLKHPVKLRGSRRCVHSPEFQAEEKLFPDLHKARQFLKGL